MKKEVGKFLLLSFGSLVLLNITLIGASIILQNYGGKFTLNPGENYIVNIPFIGNKLVNQTICGKAEQTDGTALKNIGVILKYENGTEVTNSTTGSDGKYCIEIPRLESSKKFYISLNYENQTSEGNLTLADHSYDLKFEDDLVYSKETDKYAILVGNITNEYAKVEEGRFEIKVGYNEKKPDGNNSWKYIFGDYEKYFINMGANENYGVPNEELNISWEIPNDASPGEYKFLIKTSFNAQEKSTSVFFNITE